MEVIFLLEGAGGQISSLEGILGVVGPSSSLADDLGEVGADFSDSGLLGIS